MNNRYFLNLIITLCIAFIVPIQGMSQSWYNISWKYRKRITIDHTKVPNTDQSSFPVLVSLSADPDLSSHAQGTGNDILFTTSNGTTKINYEREKYTTGTLVAWVNVATLSHTTDNVIYMYYGNVGASDQQAATSVWDVNYKGVWHMKEATGSNLADATSSGWTETPVGSPVQTPSQIDGGLSFNGTSQYVTHAFSASSPFRYGGAITYSFWANMPSGGGGWVMGVNCSGGQGYGGISLFLSSLAFGWTPTNTGSDNAISSAALSLIAGQWAYITVAIDITGKTRHFYVNGSEVSTTFFYVSTNWTPVTSYNTSLNDEIGGRYVNNQNYFNGTLDEVRVSNSVRSTDWVKTEYNNQSSPSSFYSVANEEPVITISVTNVSCFGGFTGQATTSITGATTAYTYKWSTSPQKTTQTITNLSAATYTVTISDAVLNTASASAVITQTTALTVVATSSNPSCFGTSTGSITITANGGTSPYTFSIQNGNDSYPYPDNGLGQSVISGLAAGPYRIRTKDLNGCTSPSVP